MQIKRGHIVKIFFIIATLVVCAQIKIFGQQEPQFSNYRYNTLSYNPAYSGSQEVMSLLFLSRLQWVGIDGAPRSYVFSLDTPLPKKKIGLGFSLISDNIGPYRNNYFNLYYAHKIKVSQKATLSMGLDLSLNNYYLVTDLYVLQPDDDLLNQDFKKYFQPGVGAGLYLQHPDYYIGLSVPRIIQSNKYNDDIGKLEQHFYISGGYIFRHVENWTITPSLLCRSVVGATSLDISVSARYNNFLGLGISHRLNDALIALFDINLTDQLLLAYAYDFPTSGKVKSSNGSHELLLRFNFSSIRKDNFKSPRYF